MVYLLCVSLHGVCYVRVRRLRAVWQATRSVFLTRRLDTNAMWMIIDIVSIHNGTILMNSGLVHISCKELLLTANLPILVSNVKWLCNQLLSLPLPSILVWIRMCLRTRSLSKVTFCWSIIVLRLHSLISNKFSLCDRVLLSLSPLR